MFAKFELKTTFCHVPTHSQSLSSAVCSVACSSIFSYSKEDTQKEKLFHLMSSELEEIDNGLSFSYFW